MQYVPVKTLELCKRTVCVDAWVFIQVHFCVNDKIICSYNKLDGKQKTGNSWLENPDEQQGLYVINPK